MKKIILLLAFTCSIFIVFAIISSNSTTYGPFHHSARVDQPSEICNFNNKIYCSKNNSLYELSNETFIEKKIYEDKNHPLEMIRNVKADNDKIIISTIDKTFIFDKDFTLSEKLDFSSNGLFLIEQNYIYYTINKGSIELLKYNILTKETYLLSNDIGNSTFKNDDKLIFCDDWGNLYFINDDTNNFFTFNSHYGGHSFLIKKLV